MVLSTPADICSGGINNLIIADNPHLTVYFPAEDFYFRSLLCIPGDLLRKVRDCKYVCLRKFLPAPDFMGLRPIPPRYEFLIYLTCCRQQISFRKPVSILLSTLPYASAGYNTYRKFPCIPSERLPDRSEELPSFSVYQLYFHYY